MIIDEITHKIETFIGFEPTHDQQNAINVFANFFVDKIEQTAMIIKGSAGTGKTRLASAIVKTLLFYNQKVVLLAPTGRAAKVFSLNSGVNALTIHRKIYRQKTFVGLETPFNLNDNLHKDTLFVVDESSMIASQQNYNTPFGTGNLLDDLIKYVYNSNNNCRLVFIGDEYQLPPVGQELSFALDVYSLESYSLKVYEASLNEVLRQQQESGILFNANYVRNLIKQDSWGLYPQLTTTNFADISVVSGEELIESLAYSYREVGVDETIVITRSNSRAKTYNQGIRYRVLENESELNTGDMVMIVKNNYYWTEQAKAPISFIANGDRAIVKQIRNVRQLYGFTFADVTLTLPDYNNYELFTTAILDCLYTDSPTLTKEQNEQLFNQIALDYADVELKTNKMKSIRSDAYYNSLQLKYAYAITCHKAQGGQWAHVYIDQGYINEEMLTPDYYHWLYTAMTRASEHVYLVNWKNKI